MSHHGSFAHATCVTCGWQGAGRRAVGRARVDAEAHQLLGPAVTDVTIDLRPARVHARHDA